MTEDYHAKYIHAQFDIVELRASFNVLLTETLDRLLSDAQDALEIDAPKTAHSRVKHAREAIANWKKANPTEKE